MIRKVAWKPREDEFAENDKSSVSDAAGRSSQTGLG